MPTAAARRSRRPPTATPARRAAYDVLRRVFERGAYADRALHAAAGGLDPRERALATQLAYGAVQRRATLDHVIELAAERDPETLDGPVLAALRLGIFQLAFLDAIPAHAAVNASVALARRDAPRASGLVNAVLRRAARDARETVEALTDDTPQDAALKHSVPLWLAERWFAELGAEEARALLAAVNTPAEAALRANGLVTTAAELARAVPGHVAGAADPDAVVLDAPFDAHGHELFDRGAYQPQSRASQRVARAVDPQPGERVLDLCAAPGGKTTHLAALMGSGRVVAVERQEARAAQLTRTVARLKADGIVRVDHADATDPRRDGPFDRVLVDPPCSGLGTLQSRPDLRWHAREEAPVELQAQILDVAAGAAPQRLVYSTCTISRAENEEQVAAFLARHPEYSLSAEHVTLPHRDATDGFYIATLDRA